MKPVKNRIVELDVLRGFALLGIYISIIHGFNYSIHYDNRIFSQYNNFDVLLDSINMIFISKRFIGIFSLLFGIGIAIQQDRFRKRNKNFTTYFLKRMLILGIFGLINTTFFFWGEILLVYSLFGIAVLVISKLNYKLLLLIALFSFICWHPIFEFYFSDDIINQLSFFPKEYPFKRIVEIYTSGSFLEMAKLRWIEYGVLFSVNSFHMGVSFALITTGYVIGIKDFHHWFIKNLLKSQKIFYLVILFSVSYGVYAFSTQKVSSNIHDGWGVYLVYLFFILATIFVYVYAITLACKNGRNKLLKFFANNGRLSLTGYMGAACIYAFIFHNNGLGLYLNFGITVQTFIAIGLYIMFTIFSHFWLTKFKQGPLEWVYRRISY